MTHRTQTPGSARISGQPGRITTQISPLLAGCAAALFAAGVVAGLVDYLHRSPVRERPVPGTAAWVPQLIAAAVACAWYGAARWRHSRRPGRRGAPLLLLAPLGRSAATRLAATLRDASWRAAAALPPLGIIGYSFWRAGRQVTGGLDPNFTVNAWGGPTYAGAMACHYLDLALMTAAAAWLLGQILVPADRAARPGFP